MAHDERRAEPTLWADDLRSLHRASDTAHDAMSRLHQWLWENVSASDVLPRELPREVAHLLEDLAGQLRIVRSVEVELFERFCARPASKLAAGFPLSREEYHLLVAMGVMDGWSKVLGVSPVSDYEAFQLLCYEDEHSRCYINPDAPVRRPGDQLVGMRFGKPPEELRVDALRPEQREFFARYAPELLARFQNAEHARD